jgi:hypothetical protein
VAQCGKPLLSSGAESINCAMKQLLTAVFGDYQPEHAHVRPERTLVKAAISLANKTIWPRNVASYVTPSGNSPQCSAGILSEL